MGQTGDELSKRISKHRYDTKSRPNNNELSKHLASERHDFERDIEEEQNKNYGNRIKTN